MGKPIAARAAGWDAQFREGSDGHYAARQKPAASGRTLATAPAASTR